MPREGQVAKNFFQAPPSAQAWECPPFAIVRVNSLFHPLHRKTIGEFLLFAEKIVLILAGSERMQAAACRDCTC